MMSIRLRFTLLYNAILAVTLTVFGVALYSIQSNSTLEAIKKELMRSSDTLGISVLRTVTGTKTGITSSANPAQSQIDPGNPNVQNGLVTPPDGTNPSGQTQQGNSSPGNANPPGNFPPPKPFSTFTTDSEFQHLPEREIVRVLDASGNLVASPYGRREDALPLSDEALTNMTGIKGWFETGEVQNQQMLIYDKAIESNGKTEYILQVARPLTERNHSLETLRNTLLLASFFTLLAAFGIGWVFSGITLQPIRRITRSARMIGEERDFSKRVDYQGPQDEVGQLAATTNSMLSHLQDAYQQVAASLSQQREFVADVSHELRTPLTTLRGNLGLLVRNPPIPADEQKDIINDMVLEGDRMIRLVNELLRLAHAEAGRTLKQEHFTIAATIDDCCRQVQTLDEKRTITWNCRPDVTVFGDPDALRQVLLILLDNAIKHSSGDAEVNAELAAGRAWVTVRDTGEGIPADKLARVFDRFYRADEESTSNGFGLGLPIARSLVEAQGGKIRIESIEGDGCRVIMDFPS
jgi:two-component system, OmpR family, sensor kinase